MKRIFMLFVMFWVFEVSATTITVQNTNNSGIGSLRNAISTASSGDIIQFNPNLIQTGSATILLSTEIIINEGITINGLYSSTDTLYISGGDLTRVFYVDLTMAVLKEFNLNNIYIIDGLAEFYAPFQYNGIGGGIFASYMEKIRLDNCFINSCKTNFRGGGMFLYHVDSTFIDNSNITNNESGEAGGGLSVEVLDFTDSSHVTINNSIIHNNSVLLSSSIGGGIACFAKISLSVFNSEFTQNTSTSAGGGIYVRDNFVMDSSLVSQNESLVGAGVHNSVDPLLPITNETYISNSEITKNTAGFQGGGCLFYTSKTLVDNVIIDSNIALTGAGVFSFSENDSGLVITGSTISNNEALNVDNCVYGSCGLGGGIYSFNQLKVNNSSFINNKANTGSGIYVNDWWARNVVEAVLDSAILWVDSSYFEDNNSTVIYCDSASIRFSTFTNNLGTGVYSVPESSEDINTVFIEACTFDSNTNGGIKATSVRVERSTIVNNSSVLGGGIQCTKLDLLNSTIYNNIATGVNVDCHNIRFDRNDVTSNQTIINTNEFMISNQVNFTGSIIFSNVSSNFDVIPAITSSGYNLFSNSLLTFSQSTDLLNIAEANLNLGNLQFNGGFTKNILPNPESPVINVGNPLDISDDQNGAVIGTRDIGSTNFDGCDSPILIVDSIVACNSYEWRNGQTYTNSVDMIDFEILNPNGCDTLFKLNLTVNSLENTIHVDNEKIVADSTHVDFFYEWYDCSNDVIIPDETNSSFQFNQNGSYALITKSNGCLDTTDCLSISNFTLNELSNIDISITPNPFSDRIYFEMSENSEIDNLEIINGLGVKLKDQKLKDSKVVVDVSKFPSGVYFVNLFSGNEMIRSKVIVKN